jgi:hypothetical protein
MKKIVLLPVIAVIAISVLGACLVYLKTRPDTTSIPSTTWYECPDTKSLDYDEKTKIYTEWVNCMPSPDRKGKCGRDTAYEEWVNASCGIRFMVNVAY